MKFPTNEVCGIHYSYSGTKEYQRQERKRKEVEKNRGEGGRWEEVKKKIRVVVAGERGWQLSTKSHIQFTF